MGASSSPVYSPHAPSPTQEIFYLHSSNMAWHDITSHSMNLKLNTLTLPNNILLELDYLHISLSVLGSPSGTTSSGHQSLCTILQHIRLVSNSKALHVLSLRMLFLHMFIWLVLSWHSCLSWNITFLGLPRASILKVTSSLVGFSSPGCISLHFSYYLLLSSFSLFPQM